jgi:hypothetical protein
MLARKARKNLRGFFYNMENRIYPKGDLVCGILSPWPVSNAKIETIPERRINGKRPTS